ncbi:MAG: hypothetical protein J5606_08585 [Bacteroidales bacterium]|nr:hypothetical protein [Bacteroidales bacterium]
MAQQKRNRKVLLIEPNYANKFPPIGLMKISTYYKMLGDEVVFYKGDLKLFVIERIADKCIDAFSQIDSSIDWRIKREFFIEYIRTKRKEYANSLVVEESEMSLLLWAKLIEFKDYYWNGIWKQKQEREWDIVGVTTLFTFYWDITIKTIEFAKLLVKDENSLMVGGVLASIQPQEVSIATGLRIHERGSTGGIHIGILHPGDLDKDNDIPIDELELDYSILDEIDYQYPMSNAYYRYTTRGCVRNCAFCAVKTLEPIYQDYIPLKTRIDNIREKYGEQKDLLLMDNNVLASKHFVKIIQEIKDCGFAKGAKFSQPNLLDISIRNLKNGTNDRAYIRKSQKLLMELYKKLKDKEESYFAYQVLFQKFHINKIQSATKENILLAYDELKDLYDKHYQPGKGKLRFVDFNQGLDARLFTPEKASLFGQIAIRPVRIAFDDIKTKEKYCAAIRMCKNVGIKDFSNYLLYNYKDHPDDLYNRLRINVDLCDKLEISIYSFPMKFHPIRKTDDMEEDFSHNRDYIGVNWNRKYIRAIQAILNSTKGKIGRGTFFFKKAFGENLEEYHKLLEMPETMIIYRFFFEWLGCEKGIRKAEEILGHSMEFVSTQAWWICFNECRITLSKKDWNEVLDYIHKNDFENNSHFTNPIVIKLLSFYENNRKAIIDTKTELFKMKLEYDKNPIQELKRHIKNTKK